jgi:hypothetical protein
MYKAGTEIGGRVVDKVPYVPNIKIDDVLGFAPEILAYGAAHGTSDLARYKVTRIISEKIDGDEAVVRFHVLSYERSKKSKNKSISTD